MHCPGTEHTRYSTVQSPLLGRSGKFAPELSTHGGLRDEGAEFRTQRAMAYRRTHSNGECPRPANGDRLLRASPSVRYRRLPSLDGPKLTVRSQSEAAFASTGCLAPNGG